MFCFGTDPEFMIFNRYGDLQSAIGLIPATKEKRLGIGNDSFIFPDNVMLELNVPAGKGLSNTMSILSNAFSKVAEAISPNVFLPVASATFPEELLQHEDAKKFGCDPEYCAYDYTVIPPPSSPGNFRSAGGHVHLGSTEEGSIPLMAVVEGVDRTQRELGRLRVVRMLDLFLGIPSVLMDHDPSSPERRKLYGKAGSHRAKESYGVEYRSLSNFWLSSPKTVAIVYDLSRWVVDFVANDKYKLFWQDDSTCVGYNLTQVREAIDNSDKSKAGDIMNKIVKKYIPANMFQRIFSLSEHNQHNFYKEWEIS